MLRAWICSLLKPYTGNAWFPEKLVTTDCCKLINKNCASFKRFSTYAWGGTTRGNHLPTKLYVPTNQQNFGNRPPPLKLEAMGTSLPLVTVPFNKHINARYDYTITLIWGGGVIISLLKTKWSLFVKSWIPFTQESFMLRLFDSGNIGRVDLEEKVFFNFINVFSLFRYYLSLEKGMSFHLNKLDFLSPKDTMCQVWLKLDH